MEKKSDETVCHLRLRQTDTYLLVSRRDYSNESPAIHQIVSRDINIKCILCALYFVWLLFTFHRLVKVITLQLSTKSIKREREHSQVKYNMHISYFILHSYFLASSI